MLASLELYQKILWVSRTAIAAIYIVGAIVLARVVWRWVMLLLEPADSEAAGAAAPNHSQMTARRGMRRLVAGLAAFLAFCLAGPILVVLAYAHWIEPRRLQITRLKISSRKLQSMDEPLRILHVSDIHCEAFAQMEGDLVRTASSNRPDMILFTGDCANDADGVLRFRGLLRDLGQIAPVYVVGGNWDVEQLAAFDKYSGTGAVELTGQPIRLGKGGGGVVLQGLAIDHEKEMEAALGRLSAADFNILMYHYPDQAGVASRFPVDLYLAGHTHGGQVHSERYGSVTLSKRMRHYAAGLYTFGPQRLYVNKGVGYGWRIRYNRRPEIAVFDFAGSPTEPERGTVVESDLAGE